GRPRPVNGAVEKLLDANNGSGHRTVGRETQSGHAFPAVSATWAAASGPSSSSTASPSASSTGTPSCRALSYFDPGDSPTTTNDVFFDTELDTLPPRDWMAAVASSRGYTSVVPVTTKLSPARLCGRAGPGRLRA